MCCVDTDHDACESVRWSNKALCGADVETQAEVQNLGQNCGTLSKVGDGRGTRRLTVS